MLSARPPAIFPDLSPASDSTSPIAAPRTRSTAFATKTPGRHALPRSHYPATGLKSAFRKENAIGQGPKSTIARSKARVDLKESIEPQRLFKDVDSKKLQSTSKAHGLHDATNKTPAPTKRPLQQAFKTPLPATSIRTKLASIVSASPNSPTRDCTQQPTALPSRPLEPPPSALRPSSSRRSSRVIRSASKSFETPVSVPGSKKHWEVSEGDISVGGLSEVSIQEAVEEELDSDEDEIEYMAPTAYVEPYSPSFAMPDYKELCKEFMKGVARMPGFGGPVRLYEEDFDMDDEYIEQTIKDVPVISTKTLPEDEIFGPPLAFAPSKFNSTKTAKQLASRTALATHQALKPRAGTTTSASSSSRPPPSRPHIKGSVRSGVTAGPSAARPVAARTPGSKGLAGPTKSLPMRSTVAAPIKSLPAEETLDVFLDREFLPVDGGFMFDV